MNTSYREIGVCGLSCRLCPTYHTKGVSRCGGCKSDYRMGAGCSFITCAVKKKGIEFCWQCTEEATCEKWSSHRAFGRERDTFTCYQKLEDNIALIQREGVEAFEETQIIRERLLAEMLLEFNEGRSKRYYCIAATVLEIGELRSALDRARSDSTGLDLRDRSRLLHSVIDGIGDTNHHCLRLRSKRT